MEYAIPCTTHGGATERTNASVTKHRASESGRCMSYGHDTNRPDATFFFFSFNNNGIMCHQFPRYQICTPELVCHFLNINSIVRLLPVRSSERSTIGRLSESANRSSTPSKNKHGYWETLDMIHLTSTSKKIYIYVLNMRVWD